MLFLERIYRKNSDLKNDLETRLLDLILKISSEEIMLALRQRIV